VEPDTGSAEEVAVVVGDVRTNTVYSSVRRGAFVQSGITVNGVLKNTKPPVSMVSLPDEANFVVAGGLRTASRQRRCAVNSSSTVTTLAVGVLYTPAAVAATSTGTATELEMLIVAAVAEANAVVYPRSGVQMEIHLCVNTLAASAVVSGEPFSMLNAFSNSRAVAAVRDANACDVMVLLATIDEMQRSVCGIGFLFPGAHAVVALECFKDNYSFLHELHHTSGACHGDPADSCPGGANGYGSRQHGFRTIEAYSTACGFDKVRDCTRIPRVSNSLPTYTWNGAPIGDTRHSNARILNANREAAAARRC
jgi:hypothetical protein